MQRKGIGNTVEVTAEEVRTAMGHTKSLTSEEEKVLRMRHGAGLQRGAELPRADAGNQELADELLLLEMQLFRASRNRAKPAMAARPATVTHLQSRSKDKIVRALRKKR